MRRAVWLMCCSALCAIGSSAMAQEASQPNEASSASASNQDGTQLEEIVVTAAKTGPQALQQVPLAIQAFTGETLKQQNVQDTASLIAVIPGASIGQETSAGIKSFNIRGVGVGGTNGETPIGYYLDEVPFIITNFGIAPPIRFLDISQVEVLRGPQGTLYGQGSAGGTMIFHTRNPDLEEAEMTGEVFGSGTRDADDLNWGASGAISVPLIKDVLAVRISGGFSRQQGYADAYAGAINGAPSAQHVNWQENSDLRVAVLFKPAENVSLRGQVWRFKPQQGFQSLYSSVDPYAYALTGGVDGFSRSKYTLYSLVADIDFDGFALTSSTSYLKGFFGTRFPLGAFGVVGGNYDSYFNPENFNEELRLHSTGDGPFHWVVGGNLSKGEGPQVNTINYVVFTQNGDNNTKTENWAGFGEISYDLFGGKLVPLAGIRYYHDKRTFEDATSSLPSTVNKTTYRLNLSYLPNDDFTGFVTVSTGFRQNTVQSALQVQLLQADGLPGEYQLDPLSLTNYEAGFKARMFDGALHIGANLYRIDFTGIQSSYTTSSGVGGYLVIGDAKSTGLDVDLSWRTPVPGLTLNAIGNYNKSEYEKVDPRVTLQLPNVRPGGRLVNSAEYNYRLDANYVTSVGDELDAFGNVNFSQTGDRTTIAGVDAPRYQLLNALVGVRRGAYELAIFGDNLTDERGPTDYFTPVVFSGPVPRTVGVRVRKMY